MGKCVEGGEIAEGFWYWVRDRKKNSVGIVENSGGLIVMLSWMFSNKRYHMPYVHLFNEIGLECLVCQPHYLNLWFPRRALAIAVRILDELIEELHKRRRPVTFASFSGGTKACGYIMTQILKGKRPEGFTGDMEKYRIVRECTSGFMFDSTPLNFESDLGVRMIRRMLGQTVGDNIAVKLALRTVANGLNSMFMSNFESQAADMKNAFYLAVEMGPALFLCSEDDKLAPFGEINKFISEVQSNPRYKKVTLVHWEQSEHVAHLRYHTKDYKKAVSNFLSEITGDYHRPGPEFTSDEKRQISRHSDAKPSTVLVKDVADMIVDDVFDLQHDWKDEFMKKKIVLTFPPMRSRL